MTDKNYTLQEAANFLGISERTVRRRVKDGTIPSFTKPAKLGDKQQYFIADSDLAAYKATISPRPTYDDLAKEVKALRRELSRFVSRVEAGTFNDGDITRARGALGDDG